MKIRRDEMIPALAVVMFAGVVIFMLYVGEDMLGLTTDDTRTLIYLFTGVPMFFIGVYGVARAEAGAKTFIAVVGVGIAFIYSIFALNEIGILIPNLEMAVTDLIILLFYFFLLLGAGMAAVKRWR